MLLGFVLFVIVVLWLLGVGFQIGGDLIHLLLVVALVALIISFLFRRPHP